MSLFFAIILGVPLGTGIALLIVSSSLNKSNNFGDSKCTINDFSNGGILGRFDKDRVKKSEPLRDISHPVILNGGERYKAPPVEDSSKNFDDPNLANISWHK